MAAETPGNSASENLPARWNASAEHPDMWMDMEADPRFATPDPEDEKSNVLGYLRGYRMTMEMKCDGLDAGQLACRSVPPSTMSLLGLVRHMADVERYWFRRVIAGEDVLWRFRTADDQDAAFSSRPCAGSRRSRTPTP